MKNLIPILFVLLFTSACIYKKEVPSNTPAPLLEEQTLEYGIETFNPKFKKWYREYNDTTSYRPEDYYEKWNREYVKVWNEKAAKADNSFFEPIQGYDQSVDYDFKLDHQLFYYFQYVEKELRISILDISPGVVPK